MCLVLFGAQAANADVVFNSTNFPDAAFRQYLHDEYDFYEGYTISDNEIKDVKSIVVSNKGISTLKGVEYFTSLITLNCNENNLTSLDLTNNTYLRYVYCNNNSLRNLYLPNLSRFAELDCSYNNLTSLNVNNKNIDIYFYLNCSHNNLTSLNVDDHINEYDNEVITIDCSNNNLSSLDLSKCKHLYRLYCSHNNLSSIDLSILDWLISLDCSANNLTTLQPYHCPNLETLYCSDNHLTQLNVTALSKLEDLDCGGNDFTSIDLGYELKNLKRLTLKNSKVTSLDLSNNTHLQYLDCSGSKSLERLRLLWQPELETIIAHDCNLIELLIASNNTSLKNLGCAGNNLTSLYLYDKPELVALDCSANQLEKIVFSSMPKLESLWCNNNKLASLDISSCTSLKTLYTFNNCLVSIVGLDEVTGPNWEDYDVYAFCNQVSVRTFERISYNGGEALGLYLGITDASRLRNYTVDGVSKNPVLYNKYLIVSTDVTQVPQKLTYDFKTYATKNDMNVTVYAESKEYGFSINGKEMTSLDMYNIPGLVSGDAYITEKYNNGYLYPTLVLDNATLEWDTNAYGLSNHDLYQDGLTIKVIGDCTIKVPNTIALGLDVATVTTIEGGGTLNIISGSYPIETAIVTWLTIQDNTTVIAKSENGYSALWDQDGAKIEIRDGGVFAAYSKYEPIWLDSNGEFIFGEGIALRYPVGAYVGSGNNIYNADGTKVTNDWVVIGPDNQATQDLITGVKDVNANVNLNNSWFDLQGRKVANPRKGIYIRDGKKIIRK